MTSEGAAKLIHHEGEALHAYQDHLGFWTIGIGHHKRKGGGIRSAFPTNGQRPVSIASSNHPCGSALLCPNRIEKLIAGALEVALLNGAEHQLDRFSPLGS